MLAVFAPHNKDLFWVVCLVVSLVIPLIMMSSCSFEIKQVNGFSEAVYFANLGALVCLTVR